ncbi:MAG TPA: hypothetical protein DDW49_11030 [Deltaproteobacteria bacterium]|nr:MAG: hypothetical protein A2048_01985 [Deltaproteobacteria bacterium GWA2_45_12]HBF13898.1 hypothetical protein [Deltaproteobacteria bacterium]
MDPFILHGLNLDLVPLQPCHIDTFLTWYYDFRYRAFFRDNSGYPFSKQKPEEFENFIRNSPTHYVVSILKETREPVALLSHGVLRARSGVFRWGYMVDGSHAGKRHALESAVLHAIVLFELLHCQKLVAEIIKGDVRVAKLARIAGFQKEALLKNETQVDGKLIDEYRYALFRNVFHKKYKKEIAQIKKANPHIFAPV